MARPPDPHAREALLRAARVEFARHGIERARIEDVAQRAGLSKGAFYLHFGSKQDAFRELVQRFIGVLEELTERRRESHERFEAQLAEADRGAEGEDGPSGVDAGREPGSSACGDGTDAGADGGPDLVAAFERQCAQDLEVVETLWRNREVLAVLEGASGEPYRPLVVEFRQRLQALLAGSIAERQQAGHLRAGLDPDAVVDVLIGAYDSLSRRLAARKDKPDLAAWVRTVQTVLYAGLLPEGRRLPFPAPQPSADPRKAS